jgi:hypothetical protein
MRTLASLLLCFVLIWMSVEARVSFGKLVGADIIAGVMDLGTDGAHIYAIGTKNSICWSIDCDWVGGAPANLCFNNPKTCL